MKKINTQRSQVDILKMRVAALKPLPNDWTKEFMHAFPEYNNLEGIDKVRNVAYTKIGDQDITEKMESIFSKKSKKVKA
jgi:hypothetical protein